MTEDDAGRRPGENKLDARTVGTAIMAGQVENVHVNPARHAYLWALLGAALVLLGGVTWWALRDPGVERAADGAPAVTDAARTTTGEAPTTAPAEPTTASVPAVQPTTTTSRRPWATAPPTLPSPAPFPVPGPAPVEVWWEGSVTVKGDGGPRGGYFFDHPEPREGFTVGDLAFGDATSVMGDEVARWTSAEPPERAACVRLQAGTTSTRASAKAGTTFCFRTRGGRVGYATVTGTSPADPLDPSISLRVLVWDLQR
ncbi:hypothetical protein [Saccharothrix hoggarensis]|uniref:Serine/threonine protein kinase n=1 Tax=Saccharothrix hoggarensis TaxID=913853 RepID=A0ABW3QRL8_9PSEU